MLLPIVGVRLGRYCSVWAIGKTWTSPIFFKSLEARLVSPPRARFDECQSVAGVGATHKGPLPIVRACKEARVRRFVRHPRCSLQSVKSAGYRKVISNMEERGKSEESARAASRRHASHVELRD